MSFARVRSRAGLTLLLSCALALAACGSPEKKAAAAHARFQVLFNAGNYMGARKEIRQAVALRDDNPGYWADLAHTELALQAYGNVLAAYERVVELSPNDIEALENLGDLALAAGDLEQASDFSSRLLAIAPSNPRAQLVRGTIALRRNNYQQALSTGKSLVAIYPDAEGGLLLMARAQFAIGERDTAIATLQNAVDRRGATVPLLQTLLDFRQQAGDDTGALNTYAALIPLQPNDVGLSLGYAKLLDRTGNGAGSKQTIDALDKRFPNDPKAQVAIIRFWRDTAGHAAATAELQRRAIKGVPAVKVALARYALDDQQPSIAEEALRPLVASGKVDGSNAEAAALYATAQHQLGNAPLAFSLAQKVLTFDKTNTTALLVRADLYITKRQFDEALADAQLLAGDNPQFEAGRIELAKVYAARGEFALASQTFQRASLDFPGGDLTAREYVAYLMARGDNAGAATQSKLFVSNNPASLSGWKTRAMLCNRTGDKACADEAGSKIRAIENGASAAASRNGVGKA